MTEQRTISARWVAPVVAPPIADGIVSHANDRITYVGPADGRHIDERFDDAILLPGLVNAHTHLDLTGAAGKTPPLRPFPDWLRSVIEYRRTRNEDETKADIAEGIRQSLAAGVTLVGDNSVLGQSLAVIEKHPMRAAVFYELIGLSQERMAAGLRAITEANRLQAKRRRMPFMFGPHAPYSFRFEGLRGSKQKSAPISIHMTESNDEIELLNHRRGSFVEFLHALGAWDASGLPPDLASVIDELNRDCWPLLVHGNYLPADTQIAESATVVYCPRTHAAFGHPPHPFRHFLARGVRVVLGTDSLASNPDLSILSEARFVAKQHPDLDHSTLLHMITDWPADALWGVVGKLAVLEYADYCVVKLPHPSGDPLSGLFLEEGPVIATMISGQRVA